MTWELSRAHPKLAAAKAQAVTNVQERVQERAQERMGRTWHPCAPWTKKVSVANVKHEPITVEAAQNPESRPLFKRSYSRKVAY